MTAVEGPVSVQDGAFIEAVGLSKNYGPVIALDGADFSARRGEVHALLGENGAGKSTFVRLLSGVGRADSGTISVEGRLLELNSVRDGINAGIGVVFQELSLMPDLTVAQNLFFQRESRSRLGVIDKRALNARARQLFDELGLDGIRPGDLAGSLPIARQQLVEIAKVVARKPQVLVLDEATSSLPRQYALWLFDLVRKLKDEGTAVLFISHRLYEAFEIADWITVFRSGKSVATGATSEFTEERLVLAMLGRKLAETARERPDPPQTEVTLELSQLGLGERFHDVSLRVRAGEIFGLGGLQGQGQPELLLSIYGWHHPRGQVHLEGRPVRIRSPREALRCGITLVPEDRRNEGLMMQMAIRENLTLSLLSRLTRFGVLSVRRESKTAASIASRFAVRAPSLEVEVQTLSGGNQQKVLVGKSLASNVKVLLCADITRGVDVGTKAELYTLVREVAAGGAAVIFYSSDSTELVSLCHRVAVMYDRTISTILEAETLNEENIVRASVGGTIATSGGSPGPAAAEG